LLLLPQLPLLAAAAGTAGAVFVTIVLQISTL